MRVACAIMSFDRPAYLEPVLASVAKSFARASRRIDVHLFQDGARNPRSGIVRAESDKIDAAVRLFRTVFPAGVVHASPDNLGVGLNFDRAERRLFIEREYDIVLFFEDDMAVDERYAPVLLALCDAYGLDPRVGSLACYGESHLATVAAQIAQRNDLATLSQAWGFALTRRAFWQRKPWVDRYIGVIGSVDYFQKDSVRRAIHELHVQMGFPRHVISQDMFKLMASHAAGLVNLNTVPVLARYIGETGVHNTPDKFKARRFADTIVYPPDAPSPRFPILTADLRAELMQRQERFIRISAGAPAA